MSDETGTPPSKHARASATNPRSVKNPRKSRYEDPSCAYCPPSVRACRQGEDRERGPGFCPSRVAGETVDEAFEQYADPFVRRVGGLIRIDVVGHDLDATIGQIEREVPAHHALADHRDTRAL